MFFEAIVDDTQWTSNDHNSSSCANSSGELIKPCFLLIGLNVFSILIMNKMNQFLFTISKDECHLKSIQKTSVFVNQCYPGFCSPTAVSDRICMEST